MEILQDPIRNRECENYDACFTSHAVSGISYWSCCNKAVPILEIKQNEKSLAVKNGMRYKDPEQVESRPDRVERLWDLMIATKRPISHICRDVAISTTQLYKVKTGKRMMGKGKWAIFADYLGVSLDYLLEGN